jgi:hypothetical protein
MTGRPKPQILLRKPDPKLKHIEVQVVPTSAYYIIQYDNKPINIIHENRSQHLWTNTRRYMKTGYPNRGHADRHAEKLNTLFNTDKFTVKEIK